MSFKIIDNYLDDELFEALLKFINSKNTLWSFWPHLISEKKFTDIDYSDYLEHRFQFAFEIVSQGHYSYPFSSTFVEHMLTPYIDINKISVHSAKVNLFIKTLDINLQMGLHPDIYFSENEDKIEYKTLLLYLDDTNGGTEFENGEFVKSKSNRAVIFDSSALHQTVSQTDALFRKNINIVFREL